MRTLATDHYMQMWEDNIKMNIKGIRCVEVDWIHLAEIRVQWHAFVNTVMNFRVRLK
jgi:hypothetical protein